VPWCEPCGKFYSPNTLNADGTCPEHHQVGRAATAGGAKSTKFDGDESADGRVPWHFWLLAVGVLVYLGWRLVQLVMWMF
jgi:hypothetical protein